MRFDLVDLNLFVAIADARSITHGATHVGLSLASASTRIKGLEVAIGSPLLVRNRRGVALTAAGESLRDHARIVLNDVEIMRGDLAAYARGLRANIRLLTNTAGLSEHLPQPLALFLRSHPAIDIDVEERESADILAALAAGTADLGLAIDRDVPSTLSSFRFCQDRLMVIVPTGDAFAGRRQIAFHQVLSRDFVGLDQGSALQAHLAMQAMRCGSRIRYRARMKNVDAVCQLVAAGVGIAVVSEAAARRAARTMALKAIRLSDKWALRDLAVCYRNQSRLGQPVRDLLSHLRVAAVGVT